MAIKTYKTVILPASYTCFIDESVSKLTTFSGIVGTINSNNLYGAYKFDVNSDVVNDLFGSNVINITSLSLNLWVSGAGSPDEMGMLEVAQMSGDAESYIASQVASGITGGTSMGTLVPPHGQKEKMTIDLNNAAREHLQYRIFQQDQWSMGLRIASGYTGLLSASGLSLLAGEGYEWREANSDEVSSPPYLEIVFESDPKDHARFDMYYTTIDPTSAQNTPVNSIGGHKSSNLVYPRTWLTSPINSTETTITVDSVSDFDSTGLIQVGPEVMKYESLNTTDKELSDITRAISPKIASPSFTEPYPEYVQFLDMDNLFNTKPAEGLSQYRCVAITNIYDVDVTDVEVSVIQNPDSDVQLDVGIEIPDTDTVTGTHSGGTSTTIEDSTSSYSGTTIFDGKYDGCAVMSYNTSDPLTAISVGIIDRFDVDGSDVTITTTGDFTIENSQNYRILPSPSQIVVNDYVAPKESENFQGFFSDGGSGSVTLNDHGSTFQQLDVIYLWLKRSFTNNVDETNNTGAVIEIQFTPSSKPAFSDSALGSWDFDKSLVDGSRTNNFSLFSGTSSTYTKYRRFNIVTGEIDSKHGLNFVKGSSWTAGNNFTFVVGGEYCLSASFWYYSPGALGLTKHTTTGRLTPYIAPIIAKADSTKGSTTETISAGEWIISEVAASDTTNMIRLALCSGGTEPTHIFESNPFEPGLHHIYVLYKEETNAALVRVEVDGKSSGSHLGPFSPAVSNTSASLRIHNIGYGPVAHQKTQSGAYISELFVRSQYTSLTDGPNIMRFGYDFIASESTFFDKSSFIGVGYREPSTVSVNRILSDGGNLVVAKSNGAILRGHRPIWAVEHTFDDPKIVELLQPKDTGSVSIRNSQLEIRGTSVRIP